MPSTIPATSLMSVLTPQQFRATILVTIGLKNCEIAEFLGITDHVVKNILRAIFDRSGCWNRVELALRFVCESENSVYEQVRLRNEIADLEMRAAQILHSRPWHAVAQA
jgi:DNA-binding CsgD family transcriptional regulator